MLQVDFELLPSFALFFRTEVRTILILFSIGNQGGSVVRSLLRNSAAFRVRGITRNPTSPKAKELVRAGVEVVGADGFKKEELVKAFKDSWAIFANTNSDDSVRAARNPMVHSN